MVTRKLIMHESCIKVAALGYSMFDLLNQIL